MIQELVHGQRVKATSDIVDSWSCVPIHVNKGNIGTIEYHYGSIKFKPERLGVYTNLFRDGLFDLTGLVKVIKEENPRIEQLKKIMADAADELLRLEG